MARVTLLLLLLAALAAAQTPETGPSTPRDTGEGKVPPAPSDGPASRPFHNDTATATHKNLCGPKGNGIHDSDGRCHWYGMDAIGADAEQLVVCVCFPSRPSAPAPLFSRPASLLATTVPEFKPGHGAYTHIPIQGVEGLHRARLD